MLLSGVELEPELEGVLVESVELAGGVDVSEGVLGVLGVEDCIELSGLGAVASGLVACCREQAAASASALRLTSNKPRFMGHLAIVDDQSPGRFVIRAYPCNALPTPVFRAGQ